MRLPDSRTHLGRGTKQVPSDLYVNAAVVTDIDEALGWIVCCPAVVEKT